MPVPTEDREILDWATHGVAVRELATQVAKDGHRPTEKPLVGRSSGDTTRDA